MTPASFEQVAGFDVATQRALLQAGGPVERVWAAWALGVRLGVAASPAVQASLHASPAPGTRRQLLVTLAGLGERAVLRAFAEHDPDDLVRATACRYLLRTAPPDDARTAEVVGARLRQDGSAEVRQAILREIRDGVTAVPLHHEDVAPLVNDPDRDVRMLAVDFLLASVGVRALFPGLLEDRLQSEPDPALRARLVALCYDAGGARRLLALASAVTSAARGQILARLREQGERFAWDALAALAAPGELAVDADLVRLLDPRDAARAFGWLLSCAARAGRWPRPRNRPESETYRLARDCGDQALTLLRQAVEAFPPGTLRVEEQALARLVVVDLEAYKEAVEADRDTDEEEGMTTDWYASAEVQGRLSLLDALNRLIG